MLSANRCRSPMFWVGCDHVWNHGFESVSSPKVGLLDRKLSETGHKLGSLDMWIGSAVLSQNILFPCFLKPFVQLLLALLAETNFMLTRGLGTPSSAGSVIPSAEQSKVLPPIQYQSWIGLQYILPVTPKIQSGIGSTPQDPVRDS